MAVLKSKVGRTVSGKGDASLRCSVPKGIAAYLGIKQGDFVYWHMMTYNGFEVAVFTKEKKIEK